MHSGPEMIRRSDQYLIKENQVLTYIIILSALILLTLTCFGQNYRNNERISTYENTNQGEKS